MTGTVILARHGQSTWNRDHLFQGQADPALTDLGREQAVELARACSGLGVTAVACSDLLRAQETATIVAALLGLAAPQRITDLRERWSRTLTGLSQDQIEERYPGCLAAWRHGPATGLPGDSEPFGAFAVRVERGLRAAARLGPTVLVVGHAGLFRVVGHLCGSGVDAAVANTDGRQLTVTAGGFTDEGDPFAGAALRPRTGMGQL
ncbi:histidine phosphatase family protein [Georgenia sp. AZ-5]|uniref:histidine phosphatase family protein n=1 Tax=Georgenia sp. AZ-5 TaxID=3367526 RepID=UPI0037547D7C